MRGPINLRLASSQRWTVSAKKGRTFPRDLGSTDYRPIWIRTYTPLLFPNVRFEELANQRSTSYQAAPRLTLKGTSRKGLKRLGYPHEHEP